MGGTRTTTTKFAVRAGRGRPADRTLMVEPDSAERTARATSINTVLHSGFSQTRLRSLCLQRGNRTFGDRPGDPRFHGGARAGLRVARCARCF